LVSDDENFSIVKIIDFGISAVCCDMLEKGCGTLIYMAPELIKKEPYCNKVDIWAVGVIMFMMFSSG